MLDQYGVKISSDSLINYEVMDTNHSKAYKNQGMRVEYLRCLADFYKVSADYLLGWEVPKTPDVSTRKIVEKTGLSETAVEVLQALNKRSQSSIIIRNAIETISLLLENADEREPEYEIVPLLEYISAYLHCASHDTQIASIEVDGTIRIFPNRDSFENEPCSAIGADYLYRIINTHLEQRVMHELREMWNVVNIESRKKYIERILQEVNGQKSQKTNE